MYAIKCGIALCASANKRIIIRGSSRGFLRLPETGQAFKNTFWDWFTKVLMFGLRYFNRAVNHPNRTVILKTVYRY